jgi:hypothetical protein
MAGWREVKSHHPHRTQSASRTRRAAQVPGVSPGRDPGSPDEVLALQGVVGNQAASQLIAGSGPAVTRPARAPAASTSKRRAEGSPEGGHHRRRSSRLNVEHDLNKPTLAFSASYTGVRTQKLNDAQDIGFNQEATLSRPVGAPQSVESYYEFRQEVRDGYEVEAHKGESQPLGTSFAQDGPYKPPYKNEVIAKAPGYLRFTDDPGFSTGRKIPSGRWLNWYRVFFRWKVKRKETGKEWTSPTVEHSMKAPYDEGKDVRVQARAAANANWTVDLS